MSMLWDVLVVGGGPAGSRAAEVIAREGFEVLVLDRKREIGRPNHCGEGLSEDCLEEIGVSDTMGWIVHQVEGSRIHFPNESYIDFPKRGYSIRRPELDRFLADRAREAGARYQTGTRVLSIKRRNGLWRIKSSRGDFSGRYLVGAGGALCPVAGLFGQRTPRITACQFKVPSFSVKGDSEGKLLHFFHHETYRGGYAWAFHRGEEVAIGAGGVGSPMEMVKHLCRELDVDPETRRIVEGGPIPFLQRPLKLVFDHAILCGDSGGFIHPLTKGGIHGAVWSGRLAGECISEALQSGELGRLRNFPKRVHDHISRSARQLKIPHAFLRFDNRIVNAIGDVMNGHVYTDLPVWNFLRVIGGNLNPHVLWGLRIGIAVRSSYKRSERFTW